MWLFNLFPDKKLAQDLEKKNKLKRGEIELKKFSDGELYLRIKNKVKAKRCYILASLNPPPENLLKFLLLVNALKVNQAREIVAIFPYLSYARQDKIDQPGAPISIKLLADIFQAIGIKKIITFNIHSFRAQSYFKIPFKNLDALPLLGEYFKKRLQKKLSQTIVVSPDLGGKKRAKRMASFLKIKEVVVLKKFRPRPNLAKILKIKNPQKIKNKICLLIDDMIDTGGTICQAAKLLKKYKAKEIYAGAIHPVLSGKAIFNLLKAPFKEIVLLNTIPLKRKIKKIKILKINNLLSQNL